MQNVKSKVIFMCTFGTYGDIFPLIALAKQLAKRGFNVFVYTNKLEQNSSVETSNECFKLRYYVDVQAFKQDFNTFVEGFDNLKSHNHRIGSVFEFLSRYKDLLCQCIKADLEQLKGQVPFFIVNPVMTHVLADLKKQLGFDYMNVYFSTYIQRALFYQQRLVRIVPKTLMQKGLNKVFNTQAITVPEPTAKNLIFMPKWRFKRLAKNKHNYFAGLIRYDNLQEESSSIYGDISKELVSFLKLYPKPIVITLGTFMGTCRHKKQVFKQLIDVCVQKQWPAIILCKDKLFDYPLPQSVIVCTFAPLAQLLKYASLIVHHAGIGTISSALLAGCPQLCLPSAYDQFSNASFTKALGVGYCLKPQQLKPKQIARAMWRLMNNKGVLSCCKKRAQQAKQEDGIAKASEYISCLLH